MQESTPRQVPLNGGGFALVSPEDYDRVVAHPYPWRVAEYEGLRYAVSQSRAGRGSRTLYMHRFIMDSPRLMAVDHVNSNGLDNTRSNLRIATTTQNGQNRRKIKAKSSAFKGVSYVKRRDKWEASIRISGVLKHLGRFNDEVEAAYAYDVAARSYFGEFARPNFP